MTRHRYRLDLAGAALPDLAVPSGHTLRAVMKEDGPALAALMLDAYRGTIDYEGEGIAEAIAEVDGWFEGSPLPESSVVAISGGEIVSACLTAEYSHGPLVGYVMTAPGSKRSGLGTLVAVRALQSLREAGRATVDAWITEGNIASERIFLGLGFALVG